MELTQQQELLGQVISKAWEDKAFKQELIGNPVEAIEKLTGKKVELPKGTTLVVRDQTDESTIYINIPPKRKLDDVELTDGQLESVSGGTDVGIWPIIIFPGPFDPTPTFPTDKIV